MISVFCFFSAYSVRFVFLTEGADVFFLLSFPWSLRLRKLSFRGGTGIDRGGQSGKTVRG
ncbi:MAG TPA: hypothetical protein DDZ56_14935 [Cytophagales bacterium]|nr:hypothetical protein [Cytophagales bacterium]